MIPLVRMVGRFMKTWFLPSPAHDAYAPEKSRIPGSEQVRNSEEVEKVISEKTEHDAADDSTGNESRRAARVRPPSESRAVDSATFSDLVKEPESGDERMSRVRKFDDETGAE